jgi:hypothetical protein
MAYYTVRYDERRALPHSDAFAAEDDDRAVEIAKKLAGERPAELRSGERVVTVFNKTRRR